MAEKWQLEGAKEADIICSICLNGCTYPKLFKCFHVCCERCLELLVVAEQGGGGERFLTCPTCQEVTPVPEQGMVGLQSVLLDSKPTATAKRVIRSGSAKLNRCHFQHSVEKMELYCDTCGELVCLQCVEQSRHRDHSYAPLKDAFKAYKEEITSSLDPIEKRVMIAKKALLQLAGQYGELPVRQAAVKDEIKLAFKKLREVLYEREVELINQLDQMNEKKLKDLAAQRDCIEATLADMKRCLDSMKATLLGAGKEREVLVGKMSTLQQVKKCLKKSSSQPDNLNPSTTPNIVFSASADMTIACQYYGQLSSEVGPTCPPKCDTEKAAEVPAATEQGVGLECEPSREHEESMKSTDQTGTRCNEGQDIVDCESAKEEEGASLSRPSTPDQAYLDKLPSSDCTRVSPKYFVVQC